MADLDGDGYLEIVVSGVRGRIYIFESRANDSWEQSWSDSTGMRNAYAVAGGVDTDGNGVPEFFVQGNTATSPVLLRSLVFEAAGNDSFDTVATLDVPTSGVGLPHNAVGNVDMDANLEYIMLTFGGTARVYEAASIGTWCLTDSITTTGGLGAVYIEEFNQIPPNDLFYHTSPDAVVVQSSGGDSGIRETGVRRSRLFVQPNPAHGVVSLCAHDLRPLSATLSVYDVRGRLVSQGIVHPTDVCDFEWNASNAPAGVYVLELAQRGKRYVGHTVVLPTP